ncbi:hypothetical protein ACFV5G_08880 [Streptomyces sp. NPDC059766]|uniref:hypothetical protein n=1 Tax=Streptomyces sp. NPDC059766 TaxID=3346940 RepID=UPI003660A36E
MDRADLVARLREAGVPDAFYDIPGVHEVSVQPDAFYFLEREADAWAVGLRQRSRDSVMERFATEAQACAYLYDALLRALAPPPGPAESLDELLADPEEIQRQAWADYDRRGRAPDGG